MSYRDVRNLTEILRTLCYPPIVSLESFRNPNFDLVAELLVWLARRFDAEVELPTSTLTEDDRVALIRGVAQFLALKVNIKLNTRKLYQADGHAVKELLKIAAVLDESMKTNHNAVRNDGGGDHSGDESEFNTRDFDIADKLHELKQGRQLATEITYAGANLYDLLGKENDLRQLRNSSVARQYEVPDVEAKLKNAIDTIKKSINETRDQTENVSQTEASLDAKIERRKVEIERYEKRLQTLRKVRPAFMEEFNELEQELEVLFVDFATKVRCLKYLEKLAAEAERAQQERHLRDAQEKPAVRSVPIDLDETLDDSGGAGVEFEEQLPPPTAKHPVIMSQSRIAISRQERPRARTGGRTQPHTSKSFRDPNDRRSSPGASSLGLSSDSDSELFLDRDEPELANSEDDSVAFEFESTLDRKRLQSGRITSNKVIDNSDDDF